MRLFIAREEELSTIRVAIKNEKTGRLYHDSLTFAATGRFFWNMAWGMK